MEVQFPERTNRSSGQKSANNRVDTGSSLDPNYDFARYRIFARLLVKTTSGPGDRQA